MSAPSDKPSSSPPQVHHTSHVRLLLIFAASLAVVIAAVIGVRALIVKPTPQPICPQDCKGPVKGPPRVTQPSVAPGPPLPTGVLSPPAGAGQGNPAGPQGKSQNSSEAPAEFRQAAVPPGSMTQAVQPVQIFGQFHATDSDGGFSFSYPAFATKDSQGVSWVDTNNHDSVALLGGKTDSTPQEIAQRVVKKISPNATLAYQIPNARVGYQSGYGEIDDFDPQNSSGSYDPQRVIVMVAVKNGVALVAVATGPTYWPAHPVGHPTGAELAEVNNTPFYYWVNSFRWKDDPPR